MNHLPQLKKEILKVATLSALKKNTLTPELLAEIKKDPTLLKKPLCKGWTWTHLACKSGAAQKLPNHLLTREALLQKTPAGTPLALAQKTKKLYSIQKNLPSKTLFAILKDPNSNFLTKLSRKSLEAQAKKTQLTEAIQRCDHEAL